MGPKVRGIYHRGVPMGFEVGYKAFVGDDAGFLEPIHPLSYLNVDAAAWVSDGEEGLFNDHLLRNVLQMDPHVLEVGHRVIEVVVYDVCSDVVGLYTGVIDDGVKVDPEVH